jgi:hypothetical protein
LRRSDSVSGWVRSLLAADRAARGAARALAAVRDELLCAFVPPEARPLVNASIYDHETKYLPSGRVFEAGLFEWELEALRRMQVPAGGTILLGGAGAGRELVGLCRLGYSVAAFEPSPRLVAGLRAVAEREPGSSVAEGSYADLLPARRGRGPLAELVARRFDGVVFGWGSFSHVLSEQERSAVLEATRAIAPGAALLISHLPTQPGAVGLARRRLRAVLSRISAPGLEQPVTGFLPEGGFYVGLGSDGLRDIAEAAGYHVASSNPHPYPHAILLPSREELRSSG